MQKIFKSKTSLLILTAILATNTLFAQDPGGIDGDPGTPAPIDHWIPLMVIVGIVILFYYSHKKKQIAN